LSAVDLSIGYICEGVSPNEAIARAAYEAVEEAKKNYHDTADFVSIFSQVSIGTTALVMSNKNLACGSSHSSLSVDLTSLYVELQSSIPMQQMEGELTSLLSTYGVFTTAENVSTFQAKVDSLIQDKVFMDALNNITSRYEMNLSRFPLSPKNAAAFS